MCARFQNAFMHYTSPGYLVQYALRQVRNADFVPCSSHRFCTEHSDCLRTERYGYQHEVSTSLFADLRWLRVKDLHTVTPTEYSGTFLGVRAYAVKSDHSSAGQKNTFYKTATSTLNCKCGLK
jgi:hypothetical protein